VKEIRNGKGSKEFEKWFDDAKKIKAECEQLFEVSEKFIDPRIKQKQFLRI